MYRSPRTYDQSLLRKKSRNKLPKDDNGASLNAGKILISNADIYTYQISKIGPTLSSTKLHFWTYIKHDLCLVIRYAIHR